MTASAGIRIRLRIMMILAGIYGTDQAHHTTPPPPTIPPTRPNQPSLTEYGIRNTKSKLRDVTYATIVKQLLIKRTYCNYWTPVLATGLRLKIVTMLSYLSIVACMGLLLAVYDSSFCHSLSSTSLSRADGLQHRLKQLTADGGMILLDGDNVRGKTKFQLSKEG